MHITESLSEGFSRVQIFGLTIKSLRANVSMTYLQASLFRVHHERPSGEQDAGVGMLQQSLGIRQLRTARPREGSFPGHGSEPSILPLPYRPPRVEPATVLRHLASFSEWVLAPRSSVGKALLI